MNDQKLRAPEKSELVLVSGSHIVLKDAGILVRPLKSVLSSTSEKAALQVQGTTSKRSHGRYSIR